MYGKRKEALIRLLKNQLKKLTNKARFIKIVIGNQFELRNRRKKEILKELKQLGSNFLNVKLQKFMRI